MYKRNRWSRNFTLEMILFLGIHLTLNQYAPMYLIKFFMVLLVSEKLVKSVWVSDFLTLTENILCSHGLHLRGRDTLKFSQVLQAKLVPLTLG